MIITPHFQPRFGNLRGTLAFTLTELIIAAALTSTTLLISGMGLSSMVSSTTAVNESTARKDELNRAMDFIAAELREAEAINQEDFNDIRINSGHLDQLSNVPVDPSSVKEVLWFEVDGEQIVYYIGEPTNNIGPWNGPQVVYRWGPTFKADGTYDGSRREHTLLIDSLDNSISGDPSSPICHSGWQGAFPSPQNLGFFSCVDSDRKVATLRAASRVNQTLGRSETINHQRDVYSRAFETRAVRRGPSNGLDNANPCINGCNEIDKDLTITENLSELILDHRGGAITCRAGGSAVRTFTTVELTRPGETPVSLVLRPNSPIVTRDIPEDSKLRFISQAQGCGSLEADSNNDLERQVIMLSDGQRIPFYEPFDNQRNIQEFLTPEELPDGENVLSLPANRRVVLFELGEQHSATPGPAYDFQDVVIVVDLKPALITNQT